MLTRTLPSSHDVLMYVRILAEAGTEPAVLVAKCDRALIESTRRNWPFLRDRRIDAYAPILNRYIG